MKKIVSILVIIFAFSLTSQAQKKGVQERAKKIMVKMTKDLNLTEAQAEKMLPIIISQMEDRKKMRELRKKNENSGNKPSKEERKQMRDERNQKQKAIDKQVANILDKAQMERYKEMQKKMRNKKKTRKQ